MSKIVSPLRDCEKLGLEPSRMPYSIYYKCVERSLFLYLVRQCAKKRGRRKANHLLTFQPTRLSRFSSFASLSRNSCSFLQKGGVPAAPSGTATLLRLSPNHRFHPRPTLAVTDFRRPRLSWLDGRCVQGPGTYSPRHG